MLFSILCLNCLFLPNSCVVVVVVVFISPQVDSLEVINKQFVRVILVPGADSSDGVSWTV